MTAAHPVSPLLQVQQLSTALGSRGPDILSDIELSLNSGEVLGVVGESGSGKSMLALSIMGLLPTPITVRQGAITLQDQDLLRLPPAHPSASSSHLLEPAAAAAACRRLTSSSWPRAAAKLAAAELRWWAPLPGPAQRP